MYVQKKAEERYTTNIFEVLSMTEELTIATTNREIGRPVVVYDDDITEEKKNKSKMSTGM